MGWKKSKDGGLDFDVKRELEYRRVIKEMNERHSDADEKLFNKYGGSAHTMTFDMGSYPEVPAPTRKERIKQRLKKKHHPLNG